VKQTAFIWCFDLLPEQRNCQDKKIPMLIPIDKYAIVHNNSCTFSTSRSSR